MIFFVSLVVLGFVTLTPTLNKENNTLTMSNVDALAEWTWEEVADICTGSGGFCIMEGVEYTGIHFAKD